MNLLHQIPLEQLQMPIDQMRMEFPQFTLVVSQGFLKIYKQVR